MVDLTFLTPELTLVGTGLAVLLIGLFINTKAKKILGYLASLGILVSLVFVLMSLGREGMLFNDTLSFD
ncbi:MAG: NADH-quinone oxidoreductase subunit N, partial [Methanomethylovorans sp.]|nr:NADH-quinone oxidoreductase subunit N [Methanomethylovorans sp.]